MSKYTRPCDYKGCSKKVTNSSNGLCQEHAKLEQMNRGKALLAMIKTSPKEIFELSQPFMKKNIKNLLTREGI